MLAIAVSPYAPETTLTIDFVARVFERIVIDTPESLGSEGKEVLLMAFNSIALEHFRAIIMLSRSQIAIGSAFALFRPLTETIVRSLWLYFCASPTQVEGFMKRKLDLSSVGFKNMITEIDSALGTDAFLSAYQGVYKQMCDYTHTGHDAVVCRLANDGGIEPNYSEERIRNLVTQAACLVLPYFILVYSRTGHERAATKLRKAIALLPQQQQAED